MRLAQKGVWHRVWLVLFALACLAGPALLRPGAARATGPIYAKWNAMGARDGSSWANAYTTLQAALSVARSGEEIWVAAGIYRPPLRTSTFRLVNGAALYGGFVGNETAREQRDWAAHVTTLSGELGAAGDPSDNCYHVIDGSSTQANTVLDGFVVTGGNANGAWFYANGGGLYVIQGSPTVRNVIFRGNAANALGGGLYSSDGSPTLINVVFSGNHAGTSGGGMYAAKDTPILINATFSGNSAGANGGGFYSRYVGSPTLANCILWSNTAPDGAQLASANDSSPTVIYSLVQGGYPGSDALDDDPLFLRNPNPAAGDYGDLRLGPGSPAIDAGDNDTVAGISTDLACNPRLVGARVDMGAYEAASNGPPPLRPGWNLLSLPLVPANTAITQALSSIAGHYDLAYTYDALDAANHWKKFNVSAPPFLNTLSQLDETQGLWIRITSAVPFTMTGTPPASPSIPLKQGWNLVGYPSQTARPIVEALASIAGKYDLVYAYDAYATNPWKKYNVSAPPFLNTLAEMGPGLGYWIRATQDCTWQLP